MFLLDQKSFLKTWSNDKATVQVHQVVYKDGLGWEAHIITSSGSAKLVTTRGDVRIWRQLNSATKDLSEILPNLKSFTVVLSPTT